MNVQTIENPNANEMKSQRKPTMAQLRSVSDLLLLCSTTRLTSGQKERLSRIIQNSIDWASLLFLAKIQGIAPLVAHNLTGNDFSALIPPVYLERMKYICKNTLFKNLVISSQLTSILSSFEQNGIIAIPLKGVVLAEEIYDNLCCRSTSDIDILVASKDIDLARTILLQSGYHKMQLDYLRDHPFHGQPYCREGNKLSIAVELHWDLEDSRVVSFPVSKIWERAQQAQFQGYPILSLSPEDNLLFLSNHLLKSEYYQLKLLVDIAELLKKYGDQLDWEYINGSARLWQIEPMVYYTLKRASELLAAPLPASELEELRVGTWRWWLLDRLMNKEAFVIPIENSHLRIETMSFIRCLSVSGPDRMLAALSRQRQMDGILPWFKMLYWFMPIFATSLLRR